MKQFSLLSLVLLLLISCGSEDSPYLIDNTRVGPLTKDIKISQLDSVFKNDSIVRNSSGDKQSNDFEIFDRDGTPLLILEPIQQFDSTSTVGYIQVLDSRFATAKGLSPTSTFGEVVKHYSISRIENTLNSAVVFIDELNLYLTIDKKELPSSLRFDTDSRITASQIPDNAKIKYFMISW
ncbi:hypothetical protein FK178_14790 [Antarcticibacterium arcticum]|uniref:Uncharacterized protein n=1 Tax=Antarcticibacterium arcticum TaxID=2585771 RepID=A0A5B8YRU9_9FLAO|nr:hypothetical protein [Antarcticibacterium arcticum]QED38909.1 hypothetical protein FK178_14790 [Antarcticibacterium arcticum]